VEPDVSDADPRGSDLETGILVALDEEGPLDWDELVDEVIGDLEDRLEAIVEDLDDANRIRHKPRGGYVLREADDGGE
jgi:hypothetical protein